MSGAPSAAFGAGLLAARLALEGLGQLDARRAHPQALEVVELPHRHVEDVDHDVAVVEQHPLCVRQPLDRERALAEPSKVPPARLSLPRPRLSRPPPAMAEVT